MYIYCILVYILRSIELYIYFPFTVPSPLRQLPVPVLWQTRILEQANTTVVIAVFTVMHLKKSKAAVHTLVRI